MEALDLILYDNTQQIDGEEWIWTPERLEAAVFTYGQPWYSKEDMKQLYGLDYPVDSKVTSLLTDSDKETGWKISKYPQTFLMMSYLLTKLKYGEYLNWIIKISLVKYFLMVFLLMENGVT